MIRAFHRWPGLIALALVTVLALSGAVLAVFPVAERIAAPQAGAELSVATLAERIQTIYPGLEQIRRAPSGQITAYWFEAGQPGAAVIDPTTGRGVASADPNAFQRWLTNLHRSLFLGDPGRVASALGSVAMLVLSVSGILLVARRVGGWRNWFSRLRGPLAGRLHVEIARVAVVGLLLSSATSLWMTASTFELIPDGGPSLGIPAEVSGQTDTPLAGLAMLGDTPVTELRSLSFPYDGDATDVFTLKTDRGTGYLDQGTGAVLAWADLTAWQRISETIYMLHTGQGAALLGAVLGLMALGVPVMGLTGLTIWLAGRRGRPRIRANQPAARAETILLVGSESGSTWGFAATLHDALRAAGQSVHIAPMSSFAPERYARADRIIVLAATYGDGAEPSSAKGFQTKLDACSDVLDIPIAVLGFGDRSFPAYCAYAQTIADTVDAKGWPVLLPYDTIDRQSPQAFARWGQALGAVLGIALELHHQPTPPATTELTLQSRRDYGADVQAPTSILRFSLPRATFWQRLTGAGFTRFAAGDLIGILPEGSPTPRLYSLASSRRDGFLEIVVKKHPGGLCSGQLTALEPGESVRAFVRRNPAFRPDRSRAPLILIGAGTGIGPLVGFVRENEQRRPIHLFFGMRDPQSDFLYAQEMGDWKDEGRLSRLVTSVSRGQRPRYVQDAMRADAPELVRLVQSGARIMVCGGRDMAAGVADALHDILAASGLSATKLKMEGRYVEDIF
ncbi:PepSY domain-containing protein [Thioclava sp. F28-4]|uniref:PepSY domain-containing protein n=1 Tax=Thioclava sp. F28-4 TaxID=1915315 RepID=UPI0009980062|nr:PepSY domain-containing protein [Thioclava sp. F28-4]OOY06763.1 N-acetylglucosamine transferase [Thioclava sp. F28-4]